jgi:hypothetical protein
MDLIVKTISRLIGVPAISMFNKSSFLSEIWLCVPLFYRLCATSVNILSSSSLYCHYMFRPNRPSSGVHVVVMKVSTSHCNAVLFSYVVASD